MKTCTQRLSVPPTSCAGHREKRLPTFLFAAFVFALWLAAPGTRGAVTLTTLYSFAQTGGSYTHGADPVGRLAQGTDGNFYGVTDLGGAYDYGTVFKVATNGTLTTLYSFTGGNDGSYPAAGLVQAGDWNFYGSTDQGGAGYGGTLFRITPDGTLTTLVSFNNGGPACTPEAEMVLDAAGNMWGTTEDAPPQAPGTVFVLTTDGQFNIIHTFATMSGGSALNWPEGGEPVAALVMGSDGYMYGTAEKGGSAPQDSDVMGYGTIYGITSSGFNLLYSFSGGIDSGSSTHDGSQPYAALVQGADGNFYGTTANGGTTMDSDYFGCGTIFKVTTNGVLTTLYAFTGGGNGKNPVTPLVLGPDGNFYGTTSGGGTNGGGTIFRITPSGALTTLFSAGGSSLGGYPNGLIKGTDGNLYGTTGSGGGGGGTVIRLSGITPTKPGVSITNVTAGMVVSNAAFTVMGTATDSVVVARVFYSLNQAPWTNAATANNWSNWTAAVTLTSGTNTFSAYALDTVGNVSVTNSVSFDFVVTNQLQIRASGLGTISPNYSNAWLVIGRNYSITSTPASGFVFTNWVTSTNWIGGATTTRTNLTFMMASNLTLQVNFVDTNKPTVSITNLTAGQRVSNAVFTVKGTASDNWQVSNVVCQLNGGGWNSATNINNWTNWAAGVTLMAGTNTVAAYAVDIAGNLSSTSSVSFDFVATNQLQIRASGLGTVSPNYSNAWLEVGRNYNITSTPASGFVFTNWMVSTNWIGGAMTTKTNLTFMMASNLTLQVNFADTNKPTVSITNPVSGQRVSNVVFTVMGTAGDNWRVSNVVCQLNGGGWSNAVTANLWTNWTAAVNLIPGTNTVAAYAVDNSGNVSTTNSLSFQYVASATLQVQVSGQGSVSPNYNNSLLAIGQSYSMTATAGTGFVFTNWTGGTNLPLVVLTNKATLQFVMQSNLMLQANFISTNPAVTIATFSVTPAAVSNTYTGTITLQIGGLTNTETVVIQKFLDLNTNGVIDGGDLLVQQFTLQDGTNFVIGGVTNFNVPGDLNVTTGAITATLNFQNGDFAQNIIGKYLYKLSSPVGHFTPLTNQFTVTNFPFPQWITGNVVSNNTSTVVSNAVVVVMTAAQGVAVAETVANNAGSYTIAMPPGTYSLASFKSNFVANIGTLPVVTLTNTQTVTTNITLTSATSSISGKVVDANNQAVGLPGVTVQAKGNDGLIAVTFTDTNGNFNARVTAGGWNLKMKDSALLVHGYLGLQNGTNVNAGTTGVTLAVHKATALIYGSVKDNLGNPFVALDVYTADGNGNGQYEMDSYTDANGNYVVGVLGLGNNDSWWAEADPDDTLTNYVFSQQNGNANINAGQALLQNFTAILATNYITGTVKNDDGNPIIGVGVNANANNGTNYQTHADTDESGYYSLNVANGSWNISINCSGGDDSLNNLGNYQCPNNQTLTISNNNGLANFTVQTNLNVGGTLQVTITSLPYGIVGTAYDQQLTADGGQANTTYSWAVISNSLPPGLSMDSGGTIQGTPTLNTTNTFTVQVNDNSTNTATQTLSLTIYGILQVTTTSLPSGTTNVPYNNQQLAATGGQPSYIWSLASGMLPPGLSLSTNGVISGTPTTAGTSNFVVRVTDSASVTATQALSLVVYTLSTSVTFTVTPPAVSNFYNGIITLQVGGLASGETVLVEKFRDVNSNGVIDTGDAEVQQFQLTDGQASVFYDGTTAVTNFNVPGDLTPADGAITAQLHPALSGVSQLTVAQYAFRLSSPVGHFAPITNLFNVTNSAYAQSFTGNVVCSGTNVPHALAYLLTPPAGPNMTVIAGAEADGNGAYRLNAPPGTYLLWAFKGGFVGDAGNDPVLALGANATITTNLSLLPATRSIAGRFVDAANTNAGLPRVNLKAGTANNLVSVGFADGNGNFTLSAATNWWAVWGDSQNLDFQGYLGLQSRILVNATTGSVAGVTIALARGTALVYGTVQDAQNHPLSGVRITGIQNDGTGPYLGDATTDQNGNYAMLVNDAGVWNAGVSGNNPAFTNYVWSVGLEDTSFTNGQAVRRDFTAMPATNRITGTVKDSNGNKIAGVGVGAIANISGTNYLAYADTDTNGNYALSVANNNTWFVGVNCTVGNDSLDNILGSGNYACPTNQSATIAGNNATNNFFVQICGGISILTASLPAGSATVYYDQFLQAVSCSPPYNWSVIGGSLPSGLNLAGNGELNGTTGTNGTFNFTVQVTDNNSLTNTQALSLIIYPFTFTTNNGTITITGYTGSGGAVTIPGMINGLPVTGIGTNVFSGCSSLTSIVLPYGVTNIGNYAFNGCASLSNVTIPNSVTSIGDYAFAGCNGLSSITIPDSVISVGDGIFFECYGLHNVVIGTNVTSIGDYAFKYCLYLTNVTIGCSVTNIGDYAFFDCYYLGNVTIPDSVTRIGSYAFRDCGVTNVTIGNGITSIDNYAFYESYVQSITFGSNLTNIGFHAFDNCGDLTSITIPNSIISIGDSAFYECIHLKCLVFGTNVTSIGDYAFMDCGLTNVIIPSSVTSIGGAAFRACPFLGRVALPNGVTSIGDAAFAWCTSLTNIVLPNSITNISGSEFNYCTSLSSITIPNSVTSIGDDAFWECGLTSIMIPNNVTYIGMEAFYQCGLLQSVVIGTNVTSIGYEAFYDCGLTNVTIPNSVTSIADNAFESCPYLTSVTIGNGVTNIGNNMFFECYGLTKVIISSGVTSIGASMFSLCTNLTGITIPDSVISIGSMAFYGCTSLTNIIIPGSVASLGIQAFSGCSNLTAIYFRGNAPSLDGGGVFYQDSKATAYYLPGTTGWNTFASLSGLPTALWLLPYPVILNNNPAFGVQTNRFGFVISWATNLSVVVEACTNLANHTWAPVVTNPLTSGTNYFSDPKWTNYPDRFYRVRSP